MLQDSFYIETYGCTSNKADSYIISSILRDSGYKETTIEEAQFMDLYLVLQEINNHIRY